MDCRESELPPFPHLVVKDDLSTIKIEHVEESLYYGTLPYALTDLLSSPENLQERTYIYQGLWIPEDYPELVELFFSAEPYFFQDPSVPSSKPIYLGLYHPELTIPRMFLEIDSHFLNKVEGIELGFDNEGYMRSKVSLVVSTCLPVHVFYSVMKFDNKSVISKHILILDCSTQLSKDLFIIARDSHHTVRMRVLKDAMEMYAMLGEIDQNTIRNIVSLIIDNPSRDYIIMNKWFQVLSTAFEKYFPNCDPQAFYADLIDRLNDQPKLEIHVARNMLKGFLKYWVGEIFNWINQI